MNKITKIFILVESILFITFSVLELMFGYSNLILGLHFTSILLSIFYVLSLREQDYDKKDLLIMKLMYIVLLPTDYTLEFTDILLPGLIGFLIIQLFYTYRIRKTLKFSPVRSLIFL